MTTLTSGFRWMAALTTLTALLTLTDRCEPVTENTIRQVTSADGTRFDRNPYSRRQAENSNGSRVMSYHGSSTYRINNRITDRVDSTLTIHPDSEPQWHPTNPDLIRHIAASAPSGDLKYYEYNIFTHEDRVIADLTARIQSRYPTARYMSDRAEGSPSANGDRSAWIISDRNGQQLGIVSYQLSNDKILAMADVETSYGLLDWVSASPTGQFVVAGYVDATISYRADLTGRKVINQKADHSDIALSANGRDTYVYIDFSDGVDQGWLLAVDLATNQRTRLIDFYDNANTSLHISGKGYNKPGWVVVSTYNCKVSGAWSCDKVMAVELGGQHQIVELAPTDNCGASYWTETQAVVNRDFTRVYFNSDSGSCGIDAEVFEIRLAPFG